MKQLLAFVVLLPGSAMAHGGHTHLPEAAHSVNHVGQALGLAVVMLVAGWALYTRWKS